MDKLLDLPGSEGAEGGSKPPSKLRTSVSLNMEGKKPVVSTTEPLSPLEYQFLLRRRSAVAEEQVEVSELDLCGEFLGGSPNRL